jgi:hypothetical protein
MSQQDVLQQVHTEAEALIAALVEHLSRIPEVEGIYLLREDAAFGVWTIIKAFDRQVRRRIYEREAVLIDSFPRTPFDFHVVARENMRLETIAPSGGTIIFSRP